MAPTVLITGASQGIGKATALLFARKGYDLVLTARHLDRLESVAQEVQSLGRPAPLTVPCDVTDPLQVDALVAKALDHHGNIDVLINNAGVFAEGPVDGFSLTIHALLPHFLQRKSGTIVNLSSIGGKVPTPYVVVYCTSKFAVTGLTESLHAELKPKGIHVCGIYPNLIKSSLMERAVFRGSDEEDAQIRRDQLDNVLKVPMVEKPEDVANAIWDAVKNQKSEIMVGSANFSQGFYRLFPGALQWVSRQGLKNKDK
jgi:short-subunit dehydrogenase